MKLTQELHCHTLYSHGKSTIEENVIEAINKGLERIVITEHGPRHYLCRKLKNHHYKIMYDEIQNLKIKYPQIEIKLAIEANIINEQGRLDVADEVKEYLEYINCGHHALSIMTSPGEYYKFLVRNHFANKPNASEKLKAKVRKTNTNALINAIKNNKVNMITHPNSDFSINWEDLLKVCEEYDVILEMNNSRNNITPKELDIIKKYNVRIGLGSDAHEAKNIGNWNLSKKTLEESNFDLSRVINVEE